MTSHSEARAVGRGVRCGATHSASSLSLKQVDCPTVNGWSGQYVLNGNLSGDWVLCRDKASPDLDWGTGPPGPNCWPTRCRRDHEHRCTRPDRVQTFTLNG